MSGAQNWLGTSRYVLRQSGLVRTPDIPVKVLGTDFSQFGVKWVDQNRLKMGFPVDLVPDLPQNGI